MHRITIVSLKSLIAVLFALLLICQTVVVPLIAAQMADALPPLAFLQWPGVAAAAVFVLCLQAALVCVWRLLTLAREGIIFNAKAFAYVDVILAAIIVATVIVLGSIIVATVIVLGSIIVATVIVLGSIILLTAVGAASPSITLLAALGIVIGALLALLVVVLRGLLRQASELESDLAEVV